jgi:hypothetical protein
MCQKGQELGRKEQTGWLEWDERQLEVGLGKAPIRSPAEHKGYSFVVFL